MISWKGITYNEVIATLRRNTNTNQSMENTYLPNPNRIYRNEITVLNTNNTTSHNTVPSYPSGTIKTTVSNCNPFIQKGLAISSPMAQKGCVDNTQNNAFRRVRSAGMNCEKPVFVSNTKIKTGYYDSRTQYLKSTIDAECNHINLNNVQFAQQGAVSNSNYILRKRFNTNQDNGLITRKVFDTPLLYAETIKNAIGDTGYLCSNNLPLPATST